MPSIRKSPLLRPLREAYANRRHPAYHVLTWLFKGRRVSMFDVGAHIGTSTEQYSKWFPLATFQLFEADPTVAAVCAQRLPHDPRIQLNTFACGDEEGTAQFFPSKALQNGTSELTAGACGSLLAPTGVNVHHPYIEFKDPIQVRVRRLDDWIQESGAVPPAFLHMDVQGAELLVLRGLGLNLETLEAVWLEVENQELYANQPLKADIEEFFQAHGWTKVVDTVGTLDGDQLWVSKAALAKLKGFGWALHKVLYFPVFPIF